MTLAKILIGVATVFLMFPSLFRIVRRQPMAIDPVVIVVGAVMMGWLLGFRL